MFSVDLDDGQAPQPFAANLTLTGVSPKTKSCLELAIVGEVSNSTWKLATGKAEIHIDSASGWVLDGSAANGLSGVDLTFQGSTTNSSRIAVYRLTDFAVNLTNSIVMVTGPEPAKHLDLGDATGCTLQAAGGFDRLDGSWTNTSITAPYADVHAARSQWGDSQSERHLHQDQYFCRFDRWSRHSSAGRVSREQNQSRRGGRLGWREYQMRARSEPCR